MVPRKATDIAREYAEANGIEPEHMVHMVQSMFQTMKDVMATYDHNMIYLPYLGTWFFRVWKIEKHVQKCNSILRSAALPISVLDTIQEERMNLIRMDAIILAEMTRRKESKEDKIENGNHGQWAYMRGTCRCHLCKADHAHKITTYNRKKKAQKIREQYRQELIQQYDEAKGQTTEGLGE